MKSLDPRTAKTRARGRLMPFNQCTIGVAREWPPHWERHPKGDVTPAAGTEASFADETPSVKRRRRPSSGRRGAPRHR